MEKISVMYHANCADGMGSAFAAWYNLRNKKFNVQFYPCAYGEKLNQEIMKSDVVYMLDFSLKRPQYEILAKQVPKIIIIDHHITAKEQLEGIDNCIFDMAKSGAVLSWEYFSEKETPLFFKYIQDRDLFQKVLPNTEEVNEIIFSLGTEPDAFEEWNELFLKFEEAAKHKETFKDFIEPGKWLIKRKLKYINDVVNLAFPVEFEGYKNVPCVNVHFNAISDILNILAKQSESGLAISYNKQQNKKFTYSLRSSDPKRVDVSKLAVIFGGGGHPAAAGFTSDTLVHKE